MLRISSPPVLAKEDYTKYVPVFKGGLGGAGAKRREMSHSEWFALPEEEKVRKRLEARERLLEETPEEGGEREELRRKFEEMDRAKEERERKRREAKEQRQKGEEGESSI